MYELVVIVKVAFLTILIALIYVGYVLRLHLSDHKMQKSDSNLISCDDSLWR